MDFPPLTTTQQTTRNDGQDLAEANLLNVPQSRRPSIASSMGSEFSHATAYDLEYVDKEWEKVLRIREEAGEIFIRARALLDQMNSKCRVQKNVNSTVKDGITELILLFDQLKLLRQQENQSQDAFKASQMGIEEARNCRKRYRSRIQGRLLKDAVLAAGTSAKRVRSTSESSSEAPKPAKNKRQKKKNKKSDRAVVEAPPVITVTAPSQDVVAGKPKSRSGPSAVLVRVAGGQSYAGVLGKIRKDIDLGACAAKVVCVRPTPKGDVLLRLGKGSDRRAFTSALQTAVGETGKVIASDKRVCVEVRDLDFLTETSEVVEALDKVFGGPSATRTVTVGRPNKRQIRMAVLNLSEEEADKLLKLGHLRVGFLSCAVRLRTIVPRCYKCLGYGHRRSECTGKDRSTLCYKCGESGHDHKACGRAAHCFLCSELEPGGDGSPPTDHVAGSGACRVFRLALEKAKQAERQKPKKPRKKKKNKG